MVITVTDAHRSPYLNMIKENADGTVGFVIPPKTKVYRRQDAPLVYNMATFAYVAGPEFFITKKSTFEGKSKAVNVPSE